MFSWWFLLCCAYIHDLRSSQVTSQNPESTYEALKTYGTDLTSMAREGKLDPVIGRDDEIRRVTWTKMENMERIWKKILFKIVQKGSSECFVYTRRVFPCVYMLCKIAGPKMLTWGDPNPGKKIEEQSSFLPVCLRCVLQCRLVMSDYLSPPPETLAVFFCQRYTKQRNMEDIMPGIVPSVKAIADPPCCLRSSLASQELERLLSLKDLHDVSLMEMYHKPWRTRRCPVAEHDNQSIQW